MFRAVTPARTRWPGRKPRHLEGGTGVAREIVERRGGACRVALVVHVKGCGAAGVGDRYRRKNRRVDVAVADVDRAGATAEVDRQRGTDGREGVTQYIGRVGAGTAEDRRVGDGGVERRVNVEGVAGRATLNKVGMDRPERREVDAARRPAGAGDRAQGGEEVVGPRGLGA